MLLYSCKCPFSKSSLSWKIMCKLDFFILSGFYDAFQPPAP